MSNSERFRSCSRAGTLAAPLAAALLACAIFPAAADDGKQRFVSGSGRDQGDCLNRYRPCRTLSYAIAQAGKGDSIQVAEGRYAIEDSKQLFDLLSVNGRIAAGYSKYSGYSEQNASADTVLVGVPLEFRGRFEAAGFAVIVDTKGQDVSAAESQRMRKLTAQVTASEKSHAAAPCVSNVSDGFACQSISLLSHLSLQDLRPVSPRGNDVWGYTDLNTGREYAIMGLQDGLAVVDVTNPEAPEQVGQATGSATTWRDIKIYQLYDPAAARWRAYAYATADNVSDFLIVLDLSALPNGVDRVNYSSDFRAAHNAYMSNADYTFGLAQTTQAPLLGISGAALGGGNHRLYTLENPRSPRLVSVSTGGYAHDIASFPVADARKNSQCVNAQSQAVCQVLSDFNEGTVDLWDITNPSAPQRLASQPYANAAYVHSGWWTEDGRYLLVHDELDEQNLGLNTTVRVFDVSNLHAPTLAGSWVGPTRAIDHNGFVKGNRHYVANYSEGLTVLDISNPRTPVRVGYFDTYPASSGLGFVGAWGAYPFFASGTIAVADINSGLYLLRNETLAGANGSLVMSNAALAGTEGQSFNISVNRTGAGSGAVSVQLEAQYASGNSSDVTLASTLLSWADGDTQSKSAAIELLDDSQAENLELVLVRLKNPQGGATLGYPDTTHIHIADPDTTTTLQWLEAAPSVDDARGKVLIPVTRQGSASGEARVSYRTLAGGTYSGFTATQGELVWADGNAAAKIVTVPLDPAALGNSQSGTFQVELFGAVNAALQNAGGTSASNLLATVTVTDSSAVTPPPTASPPASAGGRGGGGGGSEPLWLALLAALLYVRRLVSRACVSASEHHHRRSD